MSLCNLLQSNNEILIRFDSSGNHLVGGQDPENQLRQLRQWCVSAGHELVHE
jgi:DNA invertase Pin-like site-specific DNA recombinase